MKRQAAPLDVPVPESTWTLPRVDCPHPGRWSSTDSDSTELEVTALVAGFVTALQPDLVVETGTAWGQTARAIGQALEQNGRGRLVTFETDPERVSASELACVGLPVDVVDRPSLAGIADLARWSVGFAWLDSTFALRPRELEAIAPKLTRDGLVGVHDCGPKFPKFKNKLLATADRLGFSHIQLPTPRGVVFLSR